MAHLWFGMLKRYLGSESGISAFSRSLGPSARSPPCLPIAFPTHVRHGKEHFPVNMHITQRTQTGTVASESLTTLRIPPPRVFQIDGEPRKMVVCSPVCVFSI